MQIKVSNIYNEVVNLSSFIDEYEKNYLNMYKNLLETMDYWKDPNSVKFYNNLEKEKLQIEGTYNELKEIKNAFQYLVDEYQKIGNNIYFDFENLSYTLSKFDKCINQISNILNKYNGLDLSVEDFPSYLVYSQINSIKQNLKVLNDLKYGVKKITDDVRNIEEKTKQKLSKIKIEIIKESDINEFL